MRSIGFLIVALAVLLGYLGYKGKVGEAVNALIRGTKPTPKNGNIIDKTKGTDQSPDELRDWIG